MGQYVNVPGLAGLKEIKNAFSQSVEPLDVLVGVGVGIVAGAVVKQVIDKKLGASADPAKPPMLNIYDGFGKYLSQYGMSVGSALAGVALFAAQKGSKRGKGHAVGAIGAAVAIPAANYVAMKTLEATKLAGFAGQYVASPFGVIMNDSAFGQIMNDSAFGQIMNDSAFGGDYVQLPAGALSPRGTMGELRGISQAIGEDADEYTM